MIHAITPRILPDQNPNSTIPSCKNGSQNRLTTLIATIFEKIKIFFTQTIPDWLLSPCTSTKSLNSSRVSLMQNETFNDSDNDEISENVSTQSIEEPATLSTKEQLSEELRKPYQKPFDPLFSAIIEKFTRPTDKKITPVHHHNTFSTYPSLSEKISGNISQVARNLTDWNHISFTALDGTITSKKEFIEKSDSSLLFDQFKDCDFDTPSFKATIICLPIVNQLSAALQAAGFCQNGINHVLQQVGTGFFPINGNINFLDTDENDKQLTIYIQQNFVTIDGTAIVSTDPDSTNEADLGIFTKTAKFFNDTANNRIEITETYETKSPFAQKI